MTPLLLTGFGPFKGFDENPAQLLAEQSGREHSIVEVSYAAVSQFVESLLPNDFHTLLMLGVHGRSTHLRLEMLAYNWIGVSKDVRGEAPAGKIDDGPRIVAGTLWNNLKLSRLIASHPIKASYHPGSYLCNYIYYRALTRFPGKRIGFLHVPPENAVTLSVQADILWKLLELIESA